MLLREKDEMEAPILYEDNHLLLVEKPVNIPVQGDSSHDKDLLNYLKSDIKVRYNKPGNVYLGLVHRLDRPVGGAMVFAKTSKAASRLADMLRRRVIKRKYLAVVHGQLNKPKGELVHYLYKNREKNISKAVNKYYSGAKKAILEYKVLAKNEKFSLLEVELLTGRSHQIRVQLATNGNPLFGDQKYGQDVNKVGQQIALWAHNLSFDHPVQHVPVNVTSNPPAVFPWNLWIE